MTTARLRVVQWATGNVGRRALREVIRDPNLELVGLVVYDPAKDGVDAGELCGEPATGVKATTDRVAARAIEADCVVYMPMALDLDDVVALLESGKNIVTTRSELFPTSPRLDDDQRKRILDACRRGGTSVFANGSSPGFITDALPLALVSMQRHVESIEIDEYANMSRRDSPQMIFGLMGFGRPPETFDPGRAHHLLGEFSGPLGELAAVAGRPVDSWRAEGSVAVARRTTTIEAGTIEAGTVAAQRNTVVGSSGGVDVVRWSSNWYCAVDIEPQWELGDTGWRVQVKGDAPFDIAMPFPIPVEQLNDFTPAYTANRPVNAIPYVCKAEPGILSAADLPLITPTGPHHD